MLALVLVGSLAALTAVGAPAIADTLSDKRAAAQKQERENAAKRDELAASLEGLSAELGQALLDLQAMEQRMPQAQAELAEAQASLDRSQREATLVAARLQDAKDQEASIGSAIEQDTARATRIRESIGQMAREAYKGGGAATSMDIVLGAQSTEEFIEQYGLVSTAMRTQANTLE